MSVKFHIIPKRNPGNPDAPERYHPSVKSTARITLNDLAQLIAEISTVSSADTLAVLESLVVLIPRQLSLGNLVDLGDFGSFGLRVKTSGEDSPDQVSARNIKSVLPRFYPGKRFKEVLNRIRFTKSNES